MREDLLYPPVVLSLMPTWQCTASCDDCGTFSSPSVKTRLAKAEILSAIDCAASEGFQLVVFTGGEATLRWSDLIEGIELATKRGLKTRLVTNGWWGKNPERATWRVKALRDAGLNEINLSTGDQHVRFVSVAAISVAIACSIKLGFDPVLMIEVTAGATITKQFLLSSFEFMEPLNGMASRIIFIESPWMPTDPNITGSYSEGMLANKSNVELRGGCDSIFSTHTVQANGEIGLCCGLGMRSVSALQAGRFVADKTSFCASAKLAELSTLRLAIRQLGPERTLARLAKKNPNVEWEDRFAHRCQACLYLLSDNICLGTAAVHEDALLSEIALELVNERIATAHGIR